MSHSYSCIRLHLVFSTKDRLNQIPDELQPRLWAYLGGIGRNHGFTVIRVGGTANHVHILFILPSTMTIAKAVQLLKGSSSKWLNEITGKHVPWQEGYAAFSVSVSQVPKTASYIENQARHHEKRDFEAEFLALLKKHGVNYDPRYVLG